MADDANDVARQRWTVAHHRVSLWGKVVDAITRKPISGAEVALVSVPPEFQKTLELSAKYDEHWERKRERPDRTRSRNDGLFFFLDLPEGKYEVCAALAGCGSRYGETREAMKISAGKPDQDVLKVLTSMWVSLPLPPTGIKGRIVDSTTKTGVKLAEVRLKGSGERTFSDTNGEFTLAPIEASGKAKRTLQAFAQGYKRLEREEIIVPKTGDLLELKPDLGLEPVRRG